MVTINNKLEKKEEREAASAEYVFFKENFSGWEKERENEDLLSSFYLPAATLTLAPGLILVELEIYVA